MISADQYKEYATEAQFQSAVIETAEAHGWDCWHDNDSRKNKAGFPDLVCAHPDKGILFLELKVKSSLRKEQRYWLNLLRAAGAVAMVIRPSNMDNLEAMFQKGVKDE